MIAKQGFGVLW